MDVGNALLLRDVRSLDVLFNLLEYLSFVLVACHRLLSLPCALLMLRRLGLGWILIKKVIHVEDIVVGSTCGAVW